MTVLTSARQAHYTRTVAAQSHLMNGPDAYADALLDIVRQLAAECALPPGAWYDLNTRARHAGRQVLRYRASLDQFPVFGREGHALPLGRAVQHTGEIDAANPLEQVWLFGAPANSLDGFTQARIEADGEGGFTLRASPGVEVVRFGA